MASPGGLRCLMTGRIPPSAGLSSSSDVVVRFGNLMKTILNVVIDQQFLKGAVYCLVLR